MKETLDLLLPLVVADGEKQDDFAVGVDEVAGDAEHLQRTSLRR